MARLLGIDIGTSGAKGVVIDEDGKQIASCSHAYAIQSPRPGWTEQRPEDWWAATEAILQQVGEEVDAIGLTGQMHGSVFLDANGSVIRPALLWNDQRTTEACNEMHDKVGRSKVIEITGNPALTGFQLPKLLWLRSQEPENFARTASVLLPKDYVRLRMTGESATDVTDASGVGLLSLRDRDWSEEIATLLGLPLEWFPKVHESPEATGSYRGVTVVAGAGDQAAGAVGVGAIRPGITSISLGTSGVAFASLDTPAIEPSGSLHTFCHANGGWHAMGVMLSCGGAIQWARETLYKAVSLEHMDDEMRAASAASQGLYFLPYLSGERCPFVDPRATGAWLGLRLSHDRNHMARAVMEGATFGIRGCLDLLTTLTEVPTEVRVTGGGAKSDLWMQLLADVLQVRCVRMEVDEGPAFGAAILAGVGIGVWPDLETATLGAVRTGKAFLPASDVYKDLYQHFKAISDRCRRSL